MTESKITMIELFSGIGAQERALRQLNIPYEVSHTCDCDKDAVLSYAAMRYEVEKEMSTFDFPSQDDMIEELQAKNLGYDFAKNKHTITSRTSINKLKQYYIADRLSRNLGDISKVEKLPYADVVTYSFPCTDLSVAGKGEGMVNKCECGYSWPIDFTNSAEALICPKCSTTVSSSTRSGLLGQVQRLLNVAKEDNTLPKYLLLENVKNLVGKKFKPQFDAWLHWLDSIGYNTYYKVFNSKKYGIPQNRERVFAISIRKDVDDSTFQFPEETPLKLRLKDILETSVDDKYYLPDERIEKILNSSFIQEKKRIQTTDVCDTLLARDWKDPKCVKIPQATKQGYVECEIGGVADLSYPKSKTRRGRVQEGGAIYPTITAESNGLCKIEEPTINVVGNYMPSNHDASRVVDIDGIAPTVKENHGTVTAIAEPQIIQKFGDRGTSQYSVRDYAHTIPANPMSDRGQMVVEPQPIKVGQVSSEGLQAQTEPFVVASRGRNSENPSDRTIGIHTEQRLEPNYSGCTNTLTSVQKDNYVCEPKLVGGIGEKNFGKQYRQGNRVYDSNEIAMALTAQPLGNAGGYSYLYAVEDPIAYDEQNDYIRKDGTVGTITTDGSSPKHNNRVIEPVIIDDIYNNRDARIYSESSPTLRSERTGLKVASTENSVKQNIKWRIRKLTPKECWRLMGFTDNDVDKASQFCSASALYKQAGNSICTSVLTAIFSSLFVKDGHKADVWSEYMIHFSDED